MRVRPSMSRAKRRWLMALRIHVDTWELDLNGTHVSPSLATSEVSGDLRWT
jgi:hypothetical protein